MALIVKKFGGSSVATPEKIKAVATRVLKEKKEGDQIVVVVSAMGKSTDELIELANSVAENPRGREMDVLLTTGEQVSIALLAMTFNHMGYPAISMTGFQAGISTTDAFNKARILSIEPARVHQELNEGKIVVLAGFQGITAEGDITTLGRGGSDTTAVAMAGALCADVCEIYTDVEGVYSADPRVVPRARKMQEITYNEMLEMARLGAGVMQPRSVEMGKLYGVPIHVRSTFTDQPGTIIREDYTMEEKDFIIRGVTHDKNVVKVALLGVPDQPGVAYQIFSSLAKANVDVDMIVQSIRNTEQKTIDMVFTATKPDAPLIKDILKELSFKLNLMDIQLNTNVAKVSVVGAGMLGNPGIAAAVFGALGEADVNIQVISTSEISISCLIDLDKVEQAVNSIHDKFFKN